MVRLSGTQLRKLHEGIGSLYASDDLREFPRRAVMAVQQLISADMAAYNEIALRPQQMLRFVASADPYTPEQLAVFERHIHEHPLIAYCHEHPEHRPVRIADFMTRSQFHRTGLYNEFFRPVDVEYQLAVGITTRPGIIVGIAMNRKLADFSATEKALLEQLRPHLQQAHRNVEALDLATRQRAEAEGWLNAVAPATMVVSTDGRIHQATAVARQLLAKYYPGTNGTNGADCLPEKLGQWLRGQVASLRMSDSLGPCLPLREECSGCWLTVRLITRPDDRHCLVLREHSVERRAACVTRLGLTPREAQVLAWMTMGLTDAEIARRLGAATRTVDKHLEHIYDKLGVDSRLAAVIKALEICGL